MFVDKVMQISDPIHGSIQISEIEKQIISTQVFNRLHHVLQNSTVYLTFPSNKTSRFAHSLGTMHLGGDMFKYGITNASREDSMYFLKYVREYLKNQSGKRDFQQDIRQVLSVRGLHSGSSDYQQFFNELLNTDHYEPFYLSSIPALVSNEDFYPYVVTLQSVRCAALLHDLGHPPFSHITESALNNIYIYLNRKKAEGKDFTTREEKFYNIIAHYKTKDDQLHEQLSKKLVEHIFSVLINGIELPEPKDTIRKKIFYTHVKYVTLSILNAEDNFFRSLHNIISGAIDCDRLDYVSRDPIASGFSDGMIEYERLVKTMKLIKNEETFIFAPSAQTINTIEDFFRRRWKMYKYIIMHHRVVKTDTLLREVIETLAKEYLSETIDDTELTTDYQIPNNISGLWRIVDNQINIYDGDYINHLIQWDDAWLLACLRQEYFLKRKLVDSESDYSFLIVKLEELLSNKKKYDSLYKRFDGFIELDYTLLEELNIEVLKPLKKYDHIEPIINRIEMYKEYGLDSLKENFLSVSLFTHVLDELFIILDKTEFDKIIIKSINDIAARYEVEDFIFKRNKLNTGLDKEPIAVYYSGEIQPMEKYSNIKAELTTNKSVFPPFYIYLYSDKQEIAINDFRKELSSTIAKNIEQTLQEVYNDK